MIKVFAENETKLLQLGQHFAKACQACLAEMPDIGLVVYLNGELGAGKTTFTRQVVQTFGHQGNVKSPTYTLVEEYLLPPFTLYHFDLYRLADPEELEFIGIRDYFRPQTLCLLEWASRGEGVIPEADIIIQIDYAQTGRDLALEANSKDGKRLLQKF